MDITKINAMTDQEVKDTIITLLQRVNREGMDKLIKYLTSDKCDFFTAPASTRFHGAFPGGLARHSLNVFFRLSELVTSASQPGDVLAGQGQNLSDSVILISLLHDLCKVNFYKVEMRNKKNENGQWEQVPFYMIDDELPYGHGEKSVYMISGFIKLTRDEAMAIRWHMGYSDNEFKAGGYSVGNAFEKCPLAVLTHLADLEASYFNEKKGD